MPMTTDTSTAKAATSTVYNSTNTTKAASNTTTIPTMGRFRPALVDALATLERLAAANTAVVRRADARVAIPASAQAHVQRYGAQDLEPLTWFHSKVLPTATLLSIVDMVGKRITTFDDATGLIAAAIMLRYSETTGLPLTSHMLHRLFLAALLVAAKAHHDAVPRNRDFARVSGVQEREVNRLELALVTALDWRALVTHDQMVAAIDKADRQVRAMERALERKQDAAALCSMSLSSEDGFHLPVAEPASQHTSPAASTTALPPSAASCTLGGSTSTTLPPLPARASK